MNCPRYAPDRERDACGTGFVADIAGQPSFRALDAARTCATNLTCRSALDAHGNAAGRIPEVGTRA